MDDLILYPLLIGSNHLLLTLRRQRYANAGLDEVVILKLLLIEEGKSRGIGG